MFLSSESRKLWRVRMLIAMFSVLILVNGALSYVEAKRVAGEAPINIDAFDTVCREFYENDAMVYDYCGELLTYRRAAAIEKKAAQAAGLEYEETRRSRWTDGLYTDDIRLIELVLDREKALPKFEKEINTYIRNTEINIRDYLGSGYSEDSFECRYQRLAGERYTAVAENVTLTVLYSRGWETFYSFGTCGSLCLLMAILIGAVSFTDEKETGMLPLLRSTKRGRLPTAVSKMLAVALVAAVASTVLTLESFGAVVLGEGLSDGAQPIQSLDIFRHCPMICSVRGYLPVFILQRMIAGAVMALFAAMISTLVYNYIITFAASVAFAGVNFMLFSTGNDIVQNTVRYTNIFAIAEGTRLCRRYCAINLFGYPVEYLNFCLVAVPLFGVILAAVGCAIYGHGAVAIRIGILTRIRAWISAFIVNVRHWLEGLFARIKRSYTTNLSLHEGYKLWGASRMWIAVLVLMVAGGIVFCNSNKMRAEMSYNERLYIMYIEEYAGEWTEEKHEEITARYDRNKTVINEHSEMLKKYNKGEVDAAAYSEHNREYVKAKKESDVLRALFEHSDYLREVYEKTGVCGEFFDETGWQVLLGAGPDYFLYATLVILACGIFTQEYGKGQFAQILRSTKRGRGQTWWAKLFAVVPATILLFAVSGGSRLIPVFLRFGVHGLSAPAVSMEMLANISPKMTVSGYLMLFYGVKLAACLSLVLSVFALSALIRRPLPTIASVVGLTLLPALAEYFGISAAGRFDFMRLFDGNRLIFQSADGAAERTSRAILEAKRAGLELPAPEYCFRVLLTVLTVVATATLLLVVISAVRYCGLHKQSRGAD